MRLHGPFGSPNSRCIPSNFRHVCPGAPVGYRLSCTPASSALSGGQVSGLSRRTGDADAAGLVHLLAEGTIRHKSCTLVVDPRRAGAALGDVHCTPPTVGTSTPSSASTRQGPAHSEELIRARAQQLGLAKALTVEINGSKSWKELKEVYRLHKGQLNQIHLTCILNRLVELVTSHHRSRSSHSNVPSSSSASRRGNATVTGSASQCDAAGVATREDRIKLRRFVDEVADHVRTQLMAMSPRNLSSTLWSIARLQYAPSPFWMSEWLAFFGRRMSDPDARLRGYGASARDLSTTVWAIAQLQLPPSSASSPSGSSMHDRSSTVDANSGGGDDSGALDRAAGAAAAQHALRPTRAWLDELLHAFTHEAVLRSSRPQDLSNLLVALVRLGHRPASHYVDAIMDHARTQLHAFPPQELCNFMWALVRLAYVPPPAWLATLDGVIKSWKPPQEAAPLSVPPHFLLSLRASPGQTEATTAVSQRQVGSSSSKTGVTASASSQCSRSRLLQLDPRQVGMVLWSCARLGHLPSPAAMQVMEAAALQALSQCSSGDLAMLSWAFGRLHYMPQQLFWRAFLQRSLALMDRGEPLQLAQWAYGPGRLRLAVPAAWLARYLTSLQHQAHMLGALTATDLLVSLANMRCVVPAASVPELASASNPGPASAVPAVVQGSEPAAAGAVVYNVPDLLLDALLLQQQAPCSNSIRDSSQVTDRAPSQPQRMRTRVNHSHMLGLSPALLQQVVAALHRRCLATDDGPLLARAVWALARLHARLPRAALRQVVLTAGSLLESQCLPASSMVQLLWGLARLACISCGISHVHVRTAGAMTASSRARSLIRQSQTRPALQFNSRGRPFDLTPTPETSTAKRVARRAAPQRKAEARAKHGRRPYHDVAMVSLHMSRQWAQMSLACLAGQMSQLSDRQLLAVVYAMRRLRLAPEQAALTEFIVARCVQRAEQCLIDTDEQPEQHQLGDDPNAGASGPHARPAPIGAGAEGGGCSSEKQYILRNAIEWKRLVSRRAVANSE